MGRLRRHAKQEAELNITSFMNLMIVLVPVLLLNMVFSQTAILDIKLPAGALEELQDDAKENHTIELIVRKDTMKLNYPAGIVMAEFPKKDGQYDYQALSAFLQKLKPTLESTLGEKKDILLLSEPDTSYQTIVTTMDTIRSYETVLVTDVVQAELFPDISLGDAPGGASTTTSAVEGSAP